MKRLAAISYFTKSYFTALPKIIKRTTNIFNFKEVQKFVHVVLNWDDINKSCPYLGSKEIFEVLPVEKQPDIILTGKYYNLKLGGTHSLKEKAVLAYVCKVKNPELIFEFGTFIGTTSRTFALNTSENSKIISIDLPQDLVSHTIAEQIIQTPEYLKLTQLYGDSMKFDYSPWHGKCDFVWVDANHDYDFVKSDTENAFKLLKPGGIIMWHDYRHTARWSGVTKYLKELKKNYPNLTHIKGTTIVFINTKL